MSVQSTQDSAERMGTESIWRLMFRLAPPVMLSELILSLYNICDSCFVGHYSADALTALSVIMPVQFFAIALCMGTGLGVNALMAKYYAEQKPSAAHRVAGAGTILGICLWALYALVVAFFLPCFSRRCANSPASMAATLTYGRIVCIGSLPVFLLSIWSSVHQASGNMLRPTIAQIAGAVVNVALDGPMIFGWGGVPEMGTAGAAYATVIGQVISALIVMRGGFYRAEFSPALLAISKTIVHYSYSQVIRLGTMAFYIVLLNMVLARFSDAAVTVLGLFYRMQSFISIPLDALCTCIIPILSFNYTRQNYQRCKELMQNTILICTLFMTIGTFLFEVTPHAVLSIFTKEEDVFTIGVPAFRIIGTSFFCYVFSLISPIFFQAIGRVEKSLFLSLLRQIFTLLPIFSLLSLIGVEYTWWAFPISETLTGATGIFLYLKELRLWYLPFPKPSDLPRRPFS